MPKENPEQAELYEARVALTLNDESRVNVYACTAHRTAQFWVVDGYVDGYSSYSFYPNRRIKPNLVGRIYGRSIDEAIRLAQERLLASIEEASRKIDRNKAELALLDKFLAEHTANEPA